MSEAWRADERAPVAVEEQSLEMQSCATKLSTIREVLLRRHMKVAFFGRYNTQEPSRELSTTHHGVPPQSPSGVT